MNRTYMYVGGAIGAALLIVASIFLWRRRAVVRETLSEGTDKVRGTARSVWGRVSSAADRVIHTERDPQTQE